MGKKLTLSMLAICFFSLTGLHSQIFSDDFESYTVGDFLCTQSDNWTTWTNGQEGGGEDVFVVDDKAFSGDKSIYFSSTSGNGGPDDVILPFGQKYTTGFFEYSMQIYVPEDKSAYLNFQSEVVTGQNWAFQVYFNRDGSYNVQNNDQEDIFVGAYPQEGWFEFGFDINLDANIWSFKVNGECVGSFANTTNAIASVDLYPANTVASFWVDDVSFNHTEDSPEINVDLGLEVLFNNYLGLEGTEVSEIAYVLNTGVEEINSFDVKVTYGDFEETISFSDLAMAAGERMLVTAANPISLEPGDSEVDVSIVNINGMDSDDEVCNNQNLVIAKAVVPAPNRAVLVEEATGTWCGWCPAGAVFMERYADKYGDNFVGIAVHNDDPMALSDYDAGVTSFPGFTGFPSVISERQEVNGITQVEAPFLDRITVEPTGTFDISATLNEDTRELEFSVRLKAIGDINAFYNLVVALVEDEVTGSGANWGQTNYYAGGGEGVMGGYEDLPATVPASQMVYHDVARALLTPFEGTPNATFDIEPGGSETMSFSYTIPEAYNIDHMSIATILLGADGSVDNAKEVSIEDAVNFVSIVNDPVLQSSFNVFPNPVGTLMNVKIESPNAANVKLEIYNMQGQLVQTDSKTGFSGQQHWLVNVAQLHDGMYMVRATIGDKTAVQKVEKITK